MLFPFELELDEYDSAANDDDDPDPAAPFARDPRVVKGLLLSPSLLVGVAGMLP